MRNCLKVLLYPVRLKDRGYGGLIGILTLFSILVLTGSLTTVLANGAQARLTEEEHTDQALPLEPQQVRFDHLSTEDGLSESRVWGIIQDRRGFMWFTTYDGINRYDGFEFEVYKYDPENPNSPASTLYRCALEDSRGTLWFGSVSQGLSRFDPETEQWTNFRHDTQDPNSISGDAIWAIAEDQRGDLWIGTEANGLSRFDHETGQFTHYQHNPDNPNSLSANQALAVEVDRSGAVWVGTQFGGLNRFDPDTGQWTRYRHDADDPHSLSFDHILSLHEDMSGVLWIGTWGGGLDRFNANAPGEGTFTHYQHNPENPSSLSHNHVASIHQDRSGTLWIATFGGGLNQLVAADVEGIDSEMAGEQHVSFIRYQQNPNDPHSLSHNMAVSIYEDQEGMLWVGTAGGGINKLDLQPKQFALYHHIPGDPNSLSSNDVRAIYVDRSSDLWIGTYGGGLNRVERDTGSGQPIQVTHYQYDAADPISLSGTNVIAIEEDQDGMLWIGTSAQGFARFDRETETFVRYEPDPTSPDFRPAGIRVIHKDRTGALWFGSWGKGLGRLDPETGQFRVYLHDPDDPNSLSGNAVFSIYEDHAGVLWIGTLADGLNRFDRESESFTRYQKQPDDPQSLGNNTVTTINQDQSGTLWIGTGGGGLNRFDPQTEAFKRITENDGLPNNTINAILPDDNGLLWISTARGLSRFDPQHGSFRNYTVSDGLQGNQFIEASAFKSLDGELFFGGPNGLTAFFPEQIKDDENLPPVVLTNIQLNNLPVSVGPDSELKRSLSFTDKLILSQDDKVISFDFASLSYRAPQKNRCRYILEGFDKEWTEVGSKSFSATYTNLDPGQYVFRVIGSNGDGVWNKEGASIKVIVPPPWWETWWFRGGLILALLSLLAGAYRWRLWSLERRANELEIQVAKRTQELETSEREYRNLVEQISEAIYTLDIQGIVTYVSPAIEGLMGYNPAEITGKHFAEFIDPDDLSSMTERFQQFFSGGKLPPLEYRIKTSAGDVRWIHASSQPVFEQNQVVGMRGVLTDITERKQLEEQREQAAAATERERLARELHDAVSQTLYSIAAIAEALPGVWERDPDVGRQGLRDLVRMASSALAEMRTLLLELRPSTITEKPIAELFRQLVEAAEGRTQTPITLTLTGECTYPLEVKIALFRIAQEGLNNAIKHAHASRIKLGLYCQPGRVTLGVSDNGRGFNSENSDPDHFGLSIMRERAQAVGAEFTLETEPEGGTEITVIWEDPTCAADGPIN